LNNEKEKIMRFAIVVTMLAFPAFVHAATIHVPADQPTIQDGIDGAVNGDTVLVAPGTYTEIIDFKGKAITVRSSNGPKFTIINAGQLGSAVTFNNNEGVDSLLEGFTLTGGKPSSYGGGIYCNQSSPVIIDNIISGNSAHHAGGGIFCGNFSSPTIIHNAINGNTAIGGGGIYCSNSSPTITNNTIIDNYSCGIYCWSSSPTILNNTITKNSVGGGDGGGIYCYQSSPTITNTVVWNNSTQNDIYIDSGNPSVNYCVFKGNCSGTGNIYVDPLFVDPEADDFHIYHTSPCRNAGDNSVLGSLLIDFEDDPRISDGIVDIGADEFYRHLYYIGNPLPGDDVELKFVDTPWYQVGLIIGGTVFDPPIPGTFGDWYIKPPMILIPGLGLIPPNGVYVLPGTLPPTPAGPYTVYFQAMIGMKLTNLCTMNVE